MNGPDGPRLVRSSAVVTRVVAGENLVVPIRGSLANLQQVFVLSPVGLFLWEKLAEPRSAGELEAALLAEFQVAPDQARKDVLEFLDSLRQFQLVEPVDGASSGSQG